MGAFWHVSLPLEICINNNKISLDTFQALYGADYIFKENEKRSEKVEMPDGYKFNRKIDKNRYILKNDVFRQEFKPFYKELIETYVEMFQEYKMPDILYRDNSRVRLFNGLDKLDIDSIDVEPEKLKKFCDEDGMYFTSYSGWIPEKFVYEGYPLVINGDSSEMKFISFFYSYFKIGEYYKEFGQIYCFVETVRKTFSNKYRLSKYLALPGF
jgi:hypothetical protein